MSPPEYAPIQVTQWLIKNLDLLIALDEKSEGVIHWGPCISVQTFVAIYQIFAKICRSALTERYAKL